MTENLPYFWSFQFCTTMCNLSFQLTNTTSMFEESLNWFCLCSGYFGPPLLLLVSFLCFIVGLPVHCWCLWVYLRGNINVNLVFPLNITLLELLFCIQSIVDLIDVKFPSTIGYKIANFLIGVSWTARPIIQACMCIEQYLAVLRPVMFRKYKSIHRRIVFAAATWLIAVGNSLRLIFIEINYFRDHVLFVCFCIVVIVVSFCCISVLYALKSSGPGRCNKTDKGRASKNQQKRRAFKKISHILVSILICYVPLVVAYFMSMSNIKKHLYMCEAAPLLLSFPMIAILFSPIVRMYNENNLKCLMCFSK